MSSLTGKRNPRCRSKVSPCCLQENAYTMIYQLLVVYTNDYRNYPSLIFRDNVLFQGSEVSELSLADRVSVFVFH